MSRPTRRDGGKERAALRKFQRGGWFLPLMFGILSVAIAGATALDRDSGNEGRFDVTIEVQGEDGSLVPDAVFEAAGAEHRADGTGRIRIAGIEGLRAGIVHAQGYLDEPLVVGPESGRTTLRVSLWESRNGARFSYHAAGDVMLGRRYVALDDGSKPIIDPSHIGPSSRDIVSAIGPVFSASSTSSVNLESVVGEDDPDAQYPGKRFVIATPPEAIAALQALGADIVLGANNHVRDHLDNGLEQTRQMVEAAGIVYAGAGRDQAEAAGPAVVAVGRSKITILAYSTVGGEEVNDAYRAEPGDDAPAWLGEERIWGYREGLAVFVPDARRRIGEAWEAFRAIETEDPAVAARAWPSLWAAYPELQDWQARRGHGGANSWDPVASPLAIRSAAAGGGLVVVQFHSGFQYMPWKGDAIAALSRSAIDAGADIVIAHHPHVLQGFQWYRGRLIAYSMGNFAFDQDILATYAGGFLRTVWEADTLLEARFVPFVLNDYRPLPVSGVTANRIFREIAQRSVAPATVGRLPDGTLSFQVTPTPPDGVPSFRTERNTLIIAMPGSAPPLSSIVPLEPGELFDLEENGLYRIAPNGMGQAVAVGVNRFPYGTFDDTWTGGKGALFWDLGTRSRIKGGGRNGGQALSMEILPGRTTLVRPVGRIALFDPAVTLPGGSAAWPQADFELQLWVRSDSDASLSVRLDFYAFDDSDPTIEPSSEQLASQTFVIPPVDGSAWRLVRFPFKQPPKSTHVFPYILGTSGRPARAAVDDVELIEWRATTGPVAPFVAADYLLNRGETGSVASLEHEKLGGR